MAELPISVIIPTRERPGPLGECLQALRAQTRPPLEVIVVDSSADARSAELVAGLAGGFPCELRRLGAERGSCRQRNAGAAAARGAVLAFLDDDCVPQPDYLAAVARAFGEDPDGRLGGVQGVITNLTRPGRMARLLLRLAGYDAARPGAFLRNGLAVPAESLPAEAAPFEADWLAGASSFRAEVFRQERFSELMEAGSGYASAEDVDFSLRVGRRWRLAVVPAARMEHRVARSGGRPGALDLGWQMAVNRHRLFHTYVRPRGPGTWLAYLWSVIAWPPVTAVLLLRAGRPLEAVLRPAAMLSGGLWALLSGKKGAETPGRQGSCA